MCCKRCMLESRCDEQTLKHAQQIETYLTTRANYVRNRIQDRAV